MYKYILKNYDCAKLGKFLSKKCTGLRPIYVMFFKFLPISFQMKNNDDMWF